MPFHLADVKKTVRSRSDGAYYIHPKLLAGPAIGAQVELALAYVNARLGRPRHEFEAEMLVRFFGDPKTARGLLACLTSTYRWRARELADVLTPRELAGLRARGLTTPAELRLFLYDRLNRDAAGFLAAPREESMMPLARALRLTPAKLDQLVALDADENAVLVRVGPVPAPAHVVALYNYQAVSALVRHSAWIEMADLAAHDRAVLARACAAHGVDLVENGDSVRLNNHADLFGSYARWGGRLLRALLLAAATAPHIARAGRAGVPLPGKSAIYLMEQETLHALSGGTGIIRHGADLPALREEWARWRGSGGTGGWRLVGSPEPVLSSAGLAVAPFACRRGEAEVLLWPVTTDRGLEDACALRAAGVELVPLLLDSSAGQDARALSAPHVRGAGVAEIIGVLNEGWEGRRSEPALQALEGLLGEVLQRGFIGESYVADALGCASPDELSLRLGALDPDRATYVAGLGLCSPAFVEEMRKGLRRRPRPRPAA